MAATTSPRHPPPFSTSALPDTAANDEVESPSVSAYNALARFEFESGRGNEGTKVLMVEWEDEKSTRDVRGEWHVTWEGMRASLSTKPDDTIAGDADVDASAKAGSVTEKGGAHRMYFMLPPSVAVPPIVTLTFRPAPAEKGAKEVSYQTNPLPAIFPPELGASARTAGKKGVLHTIWAKQRLRSLQKEIEAESATNVDSVGLAMAVQEKEWIEENFGVSARPAAAPLALQTSAGLETVQDQPRSPGPASPRSPGGSRLQEKLKGLRLGTSAGDLSSRSSSSEGGFPPGQNPLSPESSDVAVSSFAAIKGARSALPALAAKPAQRPAEPPAAQQPPAARKIAPAQPPASILSQQQQMGGMGSLNSFGSMVPMATGAGPTPPPSGAQAKEDNDEDLFALPISPRSPEMTKSPFSFAQQDTKRYLQTS